MTRPAGERGRVAYVLPRFPKVSETFILFELVELERLGVDVELFSLIRERPAVMHPEAERLVERAHFPAEHRRALLAAQAYWLRRRPRRYLHAWWQALRGNARSPKFLSRALVAVPAGAWFAREMQQRGVARVHAHYATHSALAAWVVSVLTDLPYSFTAHAHDLYVETPMLAEKVDRASAVVAISRYNRHLIGRLCGPSAEAKTRVVHTGVDTEVFVPGERNGRGRPFTVLCVASLEEYKGHPYLLDACARLAADGVDFRCLLVGEGEDRPKLEHRIAELGLGGRVELLGAQPRGRVVELLRHTDAVALSSVITAAGKMEGIPVALMEAMAMHVPVVATAISGVGELVEDGVTGLLVPERDAEALAAALRRLHDDPALAQRLGEAGGERVRAEFDFRAGVRTLASLFSA